KRNATLTLSGRYETKAALRGALRRIVTYGLPEDFYLTYADRVAEVTVDDLAAMAEEAILPGRITWLVVGDREKVEQPLRDLDLAEILILDADGRPVS
ncbi:MAG: insulinase family protein, partial [Thermoanaerobaculia bacterium]|nr:insulinase family protein [Thermoanaerobaculia bacterium]